MDYVPTFNTKVEEGIEYSSDRLVWIALENFHYAQKKEFQERVTYAEKMAYDNAYKYYSTNGCLSLEELSKMSMKDISDRIESYMEDHHE